MAENVAERLARLEDFVGSPISGGDYKLPVQIFHLKEIVDQMETKFDGLVAKLDGKLVSLMEDATTLTDAIQKDSDAMRGDIAALTDVVQTQNASLKSKLRHFEDDVSMIKRVLNTEAASTSKRKVPEPKAFQGVRDAKELENFLWDMEEYFCAARVPADEQVNITSMYLAGDAKLWWRTRVHDDTIMGRPRINEWEILKKELKSQFLPCNAAWLARESLRKLEHTGTTRSYVKEFSSLMLDISNMSEDDKLFNFMSGLKPWAQVELRRQGVKDLQGAMAAADSLVDYNFSRSSSSNSNDPEVGNSVKEGTSRGGRWFDVAKRDGDSRQSSNLSSNKDRKSSGCYFCHGPHRVADCPERAKLNALVAAESNEGDDKPVVRMSVLEVLDA